jgi:hypothetical protein
MTKNPSLAGLDSFANVSVCSARIVSSSNAYSSCLTLLDFNLKPLSQPLSIIIEQQGTWSQCNADECKNAVNCVSRKVGDISLLAKGNFES